MTSGSDHGRARHWLRGLLAAIVLLGLPILSPAQQPSLPRHVGVMLVGYSPESQEALAFRQGLREAGYVEGRDVVIEWRPAKGDYSGVVTT